MKVYKLVAEEDITYRLASSYPKEGFFIAKGDSIRILGDVLAFLHVRRHGGKQKGKYRLEAQ
jgi:hypothetical protein